ncbi:hypothetical protein GPECTOR_31g380 [Gonium pectorale]|uniref:Cystatin domain-containing protein n=1 Tax=Gonium pectorale TaxID=33097 RepID=A0A150GDW0_GONPE|nr:hypothetical protein GPECTOR_31g380 [Gonium pectorale]|eukprot:KXZ48016.1 hypothetical protein GPECTOR_31g380 [Gonium pectorale]
MAKALLTAILACALMASSMGSVMVGGKSPVKVDDEGVASAAQFVLAAANGPSSCSGLCAGLREDGELKLVKVVSATSQVVAGVQYHLELLMEDTATGKQSLVTTSVWSRPWLAAKNDASQPPTQITKLNFKRVEGTEA